MERWIDADARPPFFLFVHLWDPHYDYIPPPPYDTRFDPGWKGDFDFANVEYNMAISPDMPARAFRHLVALYDGEIASTDAAVGRVVAALEQRGWLDGTLVALTSDHGEEFFDHGKKGHMTTLFEEVLHVPLLFRLPQRGARGAPLGRDLRLGAPDADHPRRRGRRSGSRGGGPGPERAPRGRRAAAEPLGVRRAVAAPAASRSTRPASADRKYLADVTAKSPLALDLSYFGLPGDPEEQHPRPATDEAGRAFEDRLRAHLAEMDRVRAALPQREGRGGRGAQRGDQAAAARARLPPRVSAATLGARRRHADVRPARRGEQAAREALDTRERRPCRAHPPEARRPKR